MRSNSRSRSETRGARAAVSTDDSQTNDKLEREGISKRNEKKCRTSTLDDVIDTRHCEPHAAWQSSKIEPPSAAIKYGSPRRDFVTPRDDGDLRPRLSAAIHKTERSGKNFDDMSVVDIAYEYSREIFRQGGGSCSQNA